MANKRVGKGVPGMEKLVCRNPKATLRYEISDRIEAGMVLVGSEVKSLRSGRGDLDGAYCSIDKDQLYLHKMHIPPYEQAGNYFGHEIRRSRKLLVHRHEIEKMRGKLTTRGYALIPLQVYFKNGVAKVQLGLGIGKKKGDEREKIRRMEDLKEARDAMRKNR